MTSAERVSNRLCFSSHTKDASNLFIQQSTSAAKVSSRLCFFSHTKDASYFFIRQSRTETHEPVQNAQGGCLLAMCAPARPSTLPPYYSLPKLAHYANACRQDDEGSPCNRCYMDSQKRQMYFFGCVRSKLPDFVHDFLPSKSQPTSCYVPIEAPLTV